MLIRTGIEIQLLSQAETSRGINVTFPTNESNIISVQSEIPNPTISMQAAFTL